MLEKQSELQFSKELKITKTEIPGLVLIDIPVHGDSRGWFKENYQKEKMEKLGLPEISVLQNNISFNAKKGVTRGIHAEPWDKFISVGTGTVFGAWVDLREGKNFGKVFTAKLDVSKAIFVPRGVANSFQALEDNTVYTYLVNEHWSAEAQSQYKFVNLADESLNICWPISLDNSIISDKDKAHPKLENVEPMKPRKILVTGGNGQLGTALRADFSDAEFTDYKELDITSPNLENERNWRQYEAIINAAAYTNVDNAETPEGREVSWKINAKAVANLGKIATKYGLTLIHISSDYVFDGTKDIHDENEDFSPLSVYGQTKAAGDIAASQVPKHYIVRTSWVVGNGKNFVKTMKELSKKDVKPTVVNDQIGRLTFTEDLSKAIKHLIDTEPPYGIYNMSGDGEPVSWSEIAQEVYKLSGKKATDISGVSTEEYYAGKTGIAPRPPKSTLDLSKMKSTGFKPTDWRVSLKEYLKKENNKND